MMTTRTHPNRQERRSRRMWVKIADLHISPSTQRETLSEAWVRDHVGIFDPEKLGLIVVNKRDGKLYVVDGWHRMSLMKAVGWGDQEIEAEVFEDLTVEEEADLFIGLDDRRKVSKTDKFRVRVTRGDKAAVAINRIVQGLGLRIGERNQSNPKTINAVQMVEQLYGGAGIKAGIYPDILHRTLRVLRDAFGENSQTWKAPHLVGLGRYFLRNPEVKDAEVIRKLQAYPGGAPAVEGKIRGRRTIMGGTMTDNAEAAYTEIIKRKAGSR